jgi:FKBP-type peptidyl-prolyl cis-trans isomerase FkpA
MATQKAQRIGIWIIAIIMTIGTIGSFVVIILANDNQKIDQAQAAKTQELAQQQQTQAAQANADNSVAFGTYTARPFDGASVTKLNVETLVEGTGEAVKATDSVNVSYFGYLSNGKIFDSSQKKDAADTPTTLPLANVIPGWTQGLTGVKVGSVVRLTIPADLGYGSMAAGIIPANSPLEFVVEVHSIDTTAAKQ